MVAIYPGTFDPITRGHLHVIRRASRIVGHLIVSVFDNPRKKTLFNLDERVAMARADVESITDMGCPVEVRGFTTLLITYAREAGATCIVRGLRALSDFEYEFQMTGMNARLDPSIETLFLMTAERWQFVSSSFVKEISLLGGDVSGFVTPQVQENLARKNALRS